LELKLADFCITEVSYSADNQHIELVRVREEMPTTIGIARTVPRAFVADLIRLEKATFITRIKNLEGSFSKGAQVHVIEKIYLTTDPNSKKKDNLGSLPRF
jgi:hypothetical protein